MRMLSSMSLSAALGAVVLLPVGLDLIAPRPSLSACATGIGRAAVACPDSGPQNASGERPLPAGDAPAFLLASVQPITPPAAWRTIYHEVERCAGMVGDYERIRWAV